MDLVAVHCRSCSCLYLENAVAVTADNALCECGGIARTIPGPRYSRGDETLFGALVRSVEAAGVSFMSAPELATILHESELSTPGRALETLARRLPAFAVVQLIVEGNPAQAGRAEAMLESILDAIAATRSRSGFLPRIGGGARSAQ
jgi:hypothetical protein